MSRLLVLAVCACMDARTVASTVGGAPPGEVLGPYLYFPLVYHSSIFLVGGAGVVEVTLIIEAGYFRLEVIDFPLEVLHGCLQCHVVCLFSGEAVGVQRHLLCQGAVCCSQVGDGREILRHGLLQIGKCHVYFYGVVSSDYALPPWQEFYWRSRRSACALMKCAWN